MQLSIWYDSQKTWVNECQSVGSTAYPNGWCAVDVTGAYFLSTSRGYHAHWGHCNAGTETCLSSPETREYPTYEYPDDAVYPCTVTTQNHPSTGVQIDVPGYEGQPCEFPFEYNGQWVFECQDVGNADYPNGWCSLTPSGVFSAGSTVRGHCQTHKSMCYTCTKAMHGNMADYNMPDGSECVFPWSSSGDKAQLTETTCAQSGSGNYPLGWCTLDADGDYDGSGTSSWGQCAPGRCVAVRTPVINLDKSGIEPRLGHEFIPVTVHSDSNCDDKPSVFFQLSNGYYYMWLDAERNWAEGHGQKRTTHYALRLEQKPRIGDDHVMIIRDDFTFAQSESNDGFTRWLSAEDCSNGASKSRLRADLTGTPFTFRESSQSTCCCGYNPWGSHNCDDYTCTAEVTGHCGQLE